MRDWWIIFKTRLERLYLYFIFIKRSLKSFWYYKKFIACDRDVDYSSILILIRAKLLKMIPRYEKGHFVTSPLHVKQMKYAVYLLDRLLSRDWEDDLYDIHHERWGKPIWTFVPLNDGSGCSSLDVHTEVTLEHKDLIPMERRQFSELCDEIHRREMDYWRRLWRHLDKYMRRWWL